MYVYIYIRLPNSLVREFHQDLKTTMIKTVISKACFVGILWLILSCEVTIHSPVSLIVYHSLP
jgi:hypothetical protein